MKVFLVLVFEGANFANLALVEVVDDGVVECLFELSLGLRTVGLKLWAAHLIQPLRQQSRRHRAKKSGLVLFLSLLIAKHLFRPHLSLFGVKKEEARTPR